MPLEYGLAFESQATASDKPHILSFATARTVSDDGLFEIWNGSTVAGLVFRVNKDGQVQIPDGSESAPALVSADDKDSGLFWVAGTPEIGASIAGSKVLSVVAAGIAVTGNITASGTLTATGALSVASIDDTPIGGTTQAAGAFTTLSSSGAASLASASVTGALSAGSIDATPIGGTTQAAGAFTTLSSSGAATLASAAIAGTLSADATTLASANVTGALTAATLDGAAIGGTTPAAGAFTTLGATGDVTMAATKKLYLDGGGNTYLYEQAVDTLHVVAGGQVYQFGTARFYPTANTPDLGKSDAMWGAIYATSITLSGATEGSLLKAGASGAMSAFTGSSDNQLLEWDDGNSEWIAGRTITISTSSPSGTPDDGDIWITIPS